MIAIDIDPVRIQLTHNNAKIYGVEDKIEFINGDFLRLAPTLTGDVVFLSPPWGGPDYKKRGKIYDLNNILPPFGGIELYKLAKRITQNVAYYVPRNTNTTQVISIN